MKHFEYMTHNKWFAVWNYVSSVLIFLRAYTATISRQSQTMSVIAYFAKQFQFSLTLWTSFWQGNFAEVGQAKGCGRYIKDYAEVKNKNHYLVHWFFFLKISYFRAHQ